MSDDTKRPWLIPSIPADPEGSVTVREILEWSELADVKAELEDPRYASRTHGSRATYALKCHGPLCKYAERHRGRKRNEKRAIKKGREYSEGPTRIYDRDDLLGMIITWHKRDLVLRKLDARAEAS